MNTVVQLVGLLGAGFFALLAYTTYQGNKNADREADVLAEKSSLELRRLIDEGEAEFQDVVEAQGNKLKERIGTEFGSARKQLTDNLDAVYKKNQSKFDSHVEERTKEAEDRLQAYYGEYRDTQKTLRAESIHAALLSIAVAAHAMRGLAVASVGIGSAEVADQLYRAILEHALLVLERARRFRGTEDDDKQLVVELHENAIHSIIVSLQNIQNGLTRLERERIRVQLRELPDIAFVQEQIQIESLLENQETSSEQE